jgi:hypothetical protein
MNDVLAQLAEANPVHAEDLTPLDPPDRFAHRRWPHRRLALVGAFAVGAAAVLGAFAFGGSNSGRNHVGLGQVGDIPRFGLHGPTGAAGVTGGGGATGAEGPLRQGVTGTSGPSGANGPAGRQGPGLSVGFDRTGDGGTLKAVGVTAWEFQKTGFQLEIRYLGPPGNWKAPYPVVYRTTVSPGAMSSTSGSVGVGPSGRSGPGPAAWAWSGRFTPADWRGGCQSGDYEIDLDWDVAGAFGIDTSTDSFRCTRS